MKGARIAIVAAALYALVGVVTFGHAAASRSRIDAAEYAECQRTVKPEGFCLQSDMAPLSGMGGALLWPFYWSWELWA